MDFVSLYTKTEGRIARKTFWIGAIVLAVANALVTFLILPLIGLGGPNLAQITTAGNDPAAILALTSGAMQSSAWAGLVILIIFAFPIYAISVKRRHDKNNNGLDVLVYLAATAVLLLVQALGLGFTTTEVQGMAIPTPGPVYTVLAFVCGIFAIYMLIVLGFLKGTNGANQFGPDPLGGVAATA